MNFNRLPVRMLPRACTLFLPVIVSASLLYPRASVLGQSPGQKNLQTPQTGPDTEIHAEMMMPFPLPGRTDEIEAYYKSMDRTGPPIISVFIRAYYMSVEVNHPMIVRRNMIHIIQQALLHYSGERLYPTAKIYHDEGVKFLADLLTSEDTETRTDGMTYLNAYVQTAPSPEAYLGKTVLDYMTNMKESEHGLDSALHTMAKLGNDEMTARRIESAIRYQDLPSTSPYWKENPTAALARETAQTIRRRSSLSH